MVEKLSQELEKTKAELASRPAIAPAPVVAELRPNTVKDEIQQIKEENRLRRLDSSEGASNQVGTPRSALSPDPLKPSSGDLKTKLTEAESAEALAMSTSTSLEIGLKLVSALPADAQRLYSRLVSKPQLMLESLLLARRFDCLQALYDFMPSVFAKEELFFRYARKALSYSSTNYESQIKVGLETIRGPIQVASSGPDADGNLEDASNFVLTGDEDYDNALRRKHEYPDVPNSDLAIQILSFCPEIKVAYWTIQLCESFDGFVTGFVALHTNIRVSESLRKMLNYGKVLFLKHPVEAHSGIVELVDSFLAQLDLMISIVNSKKPIQVQLADFSDSNKARSLRDKLLELGEFEIARDLCLRTNTPAEVVSVAWALQHLRNGKFPEARQLLLQMLQPAQRALPSAGLNHSSDSVIPSPSSNSLPSINTTGATSSTQSSQSSSTSGTNTTLAQSSSSSSLTIANRSRKYSSPLPPNHPSRNIDTFMVVDNIVQILDPSATASAGPTPALARSGSGALSRGRSGSGGSGSSDQLSAADKRKTVAFISAPLKSSSSDLTRAAVNPAQLRMTMDPLAAATSIPKPVSTELTLAIQECLFYLERFGSTTSLLKFYLKHTLIERACALVVDNKLEPEVFLERLVVPCSDNSLLSELKNAFEKVDPALTRSQPYLLATCKYLNEQKAFKTLVTFQTFMKDYVRAALTCIRVFMDTTDYNGKLKCLEIAKDYFGVALKNAESDPSTVMSINDMSSYMLKIDIQLEVLKVLTPMISKLDVLLKITNLAEYSLFGPPVQRSTIAWLLLVYRLDLGLRVLTDTIKREEWPAVFTNAGIHAARHLPLPQASQLIDDIKAAGADSEWQDLVLKAETEVLAREKKDLKTAEKFAKMISHPKLRCIALIDAGKLKSAYLEAVKLEDPLALLALILPRAEKDGDQSVVKLCTNFVTQHTNKQSTIK
jgi:hypothetical protein